MERTKATSENWCDMVIVTATRGKIKSQTTVWMANRLLSFVFDLLLDDERSKHWQSCRLHRDISSLSETFLPDINPSHESFSVRNIDGRLVSTELKNTCSMPSYTPHAHAHTDRMCYYRVHHKIMLHKIKLCYFTRHSKHRIKKKTSNATLFVVWVAASLQCLQVNICENVTPT